MITSNYEYIPKEIEVEEYVLTKQEFKETGRFLFFYWGHTENTYELKRVKKTIYEKHKKMPKLNGFGYDLIKC